MAIMSQLQTYARLYSGDDPGHVLLAALIFQAVADIIQTEQPQLHAGAWRFLEDVWPYAAAELRRDLPRRRAEYRRELRKNKGKSGQAVKLNLSEFSIN